MSSGWIPPDESTAARVRRRAALSSVRVGTAGLARHQRAHNVHSALPAAGPPGPGPGQGQGPGPADASWTTARLFAANVAVLCALGAVIVFVSSVLEHITRQVFLVVFVLLTVLLIRHGNRLRRRGLERIGRSITAWAGLTGSLVAVSGALSLGLTQFVPELLAVSAGWLLVLGVWKDLPVLVTAAVVLVGPVVWGAFLWDRSLVGAVLIVVAATAYARSGTVHRVLFGTLVLSGVLVVAATVHQLTHGRGSDSFDAADLLTVLITVMCLGAAGEFESWRPDWVAYGAVARTVSAASAVVLAALAVRPGQVESWAAATPDSAVSRVVVAGLAIMIILWMTVMSRPVLPGGRLKIATWTLVVTLVLGALTHAYRIGAVRWVAVTVLALWGLRAVRNGLRRSRPWTVAGGFAVVFGVALPTVAPMQGLVPLVLLLLAVAAAGGLIVMLSRPDGTAVPVGEAARGAGDLGVPMPRIPGV